MESPSENEADPGVNLPDRNAELIRRARHNGPTYATNKRTVWRVIRAVFHNTEAFPFIERFEVTFNGRQAWFTLKGHYLGRSFTATIRANAETILEKAHFTGRAKNFSLDRFLSILDANQ